MNAMTEMVNFRHEKVLFINNEKAGLKAIIAVHNTNLGPAIGGCRLYPYESYDAALFDVLRLSRGMSHKNAVAGLPHGGGKGVIIANGVDLSVKETDSVVSRLLSVDLCEVCTRGHSRSENVFK